MVCGGWSSERSVSLSTGKNVYRALKQNKYKAYLFDLKKNNINKILLLKPTILFNALHGEFGEDGGLTCFAEKNKISITHSNQVSSSLCLDKTLTKAFLKKFQYINIPKTYKKTDNITYPVIVKPNTGGSSNGVLIVNNKKQLFEIIKKNKERNIIEQKIPIYKELTVTVVEDKKSVRALGVTDIKFDSDYYDFKAKYTKGFSQHVLPALIPKKEYRYLLNVSEKIFKLTGCKSIARIDFIMEKRPKLNKYFFLEINTHPGLTHISLAPEQALFNKMSYFSLIKLILDTANVF